jgi:hypothetical protein
MKSLSILCMSLALLFISSCDFDKTPLNPDKSDYDYPMTIGNQWEYQRTFSYYNIRPDTLTMPPGLDTAITSTIVMKTARQEIIHDSITTFVFQETLTDGSQSLMDESYYANVEGDLYFYAYRNPGFVIPKATAKKRMMFKGMSFSDAREITSFLTRVASANNNLVDSLIYEIPPLLSLKYPLQQGSQWTYRYPGRPWRIDKRVLNKEAVRVPAGEFDCYRIKWLYDLDNDGSWDEDIIFYDYVCEKGLVKRSISYKDLYLTREDSPEPLGVYDAKDESVLTNVILLE